MITRVLKRLSSVTPASSWANLFFLSIDRFVKKHSVVRIRSSQGGTSKKFRVQTPPDHLHPRLLPADVLFPVLRLRKANRHTIATSPPLPNPVDTATAAGYIPHYRDMMHPAPISTGARCIRRGPTIMSTDRPPKTHYLFL